MDSPTPTPELASYNASCHCGALSITLRIPSLTLTQNNNKVSSCNCSICTRNGYLMVYPKREDVVFHSGFDGNDDRVGSYRFASKRAIHRFCKVCGSCVLGD
ncbi:hypothetical protein PILCRDRAFT_39894, partial [Piloderma croceum F 1598]